MQTAVRTVRRAIIKLIGFNRSAVSDDSTRKERRSQGVAERLFFCAYKVADKKQIFYDELSYYMI